MRSNRFHSQSETEDDCLKGQTAKLDPDANIETENHLRGITWVEISIGPWSSPSRVRYLLDPLQPADSLLHGSSTWIIQFNPQWSQSSPRSRSDLICDRTVDNQSRPRRVAQSHGKARWLGLPNSHSSGRRRPNIDAQRPFILDILNGTEPSGRCRASSRAAGVCSLHYLLHGPIRRIGTTRAVNGFPPLPLSFFEIGSVRRHLWGSRIRAS